MVMMWPPADQIPLPHLLGSFIQNPEELSMALFQKDVNPIPTKPSKSGSTSGYASSMQSSKNDPSKTVVSESDENTSKSESRLTVGPNIKLRGVEIEDCDTLVVEGYVEASMDSRVIEIAESGVYKGTVEIDIAIVRGRFEGELTARERLVVDASGDVSGIIRYGRLAIEEGGRVHGDLDEIDPQKPSQTTDTSKPKGEDEPKGKTPDLVA